METNRSGDLGDIVRSSAVPSADQWRLPPLPESKDFPPPLQSGGPLPNQHDPWLPELLGLAPFDGFMDSTTAGLLAAQKLLEGDMSKHPCDIFSRVLQVSPSMRAASPVQGIRSPSPVLADAMKLGGTSPCCAAVPDAASTGQISSLRNAPGIKRRKSQAKKVVCIPAPANTGSRQSGEVVPSDLWAWRKYGQKPIKGSPYPRGYYRCSSSKGCSARKQVERSRTDPSMLVITYTSEHNHPWPTHRNALAGSTRSHPLKNPPSSSRSRPAAPLDKNVTTTVKEETKEIDRMLQEETQEDVFEHALHSDDLFEELGELGPERMEHAFSREFLDDGLEEEMRVSKVLDPFSYFDWGGSSFECQAKKGDWS